MPFSSTRKSSWLSSVAAVMSLLSFLASLPLASGQSLVLEMEGLCVSSIRQYSGIRSRLEEAEYMSLVNYYGGEVTATSRPIYKRIFDQFASSVCDHFFGEDNLEADGTECDGATIPFFPGSRNVMENVYLFKVCESTLLKVDPPEWITPSPPSPVTTAEQVSPTSAPPTKAPADGSVKPGPEPETPSPTKAPTASPTETPTGTPTASPTASPTVTVSTSPSATISTSPTSSPSKSPTLLRSSTPSESPTMENNPTAAPTESTQPSSKPSKSSQPSKSPTASPTISPRPSSLPSSSPSDAPTISTQPSLTPSVSSVPSANPSDVPSDSPTIADKLDPSGVDKPISTGAVAGISAASVVIALIALWWAVPMLRKKVGKSRNRDGGGGGSDDESSKLTKELGVQFPHKLQQESEPVIDNDPTNNSFRVGPPSRSSSFASNVEISDSSPVKMFSGSDLDQDQENQDVNSPLIS